MRTLAMIAALSAAITFASKAEAQHPGVETFKQVFYEQMQSLLTPGFTMRSISFVQVTPGKATGGKYPFKVTAYVLDYAPGYPANKYYGQTCLGKIEGWTFNMSKDDFGDWIVQGRFTVSNSTCKDNPSEGSMAYALPGQAYKPKALQANDNQTAADDDDVAATKGQLYIGEYACYGTGGDLIIGLGFTLLANGKYHDLDKDRGGSYTYNAKNATITFKGGFLDGIVGKNVKNSGFQISSTINAEPWR